MVTIGILGAYIASWALADLGDTWRWMFAIGAIPGLALAIGIYFMPFSPRWLVEQGREDEARDVLGRFREADEVETEVAEIKEVAGEERRVRDLS
jgi:MFS family permease